MVYHCDGCHIKSGTKTIVMKRKENESKNSLIAGRQKNLNWIGLKQNGLFKRKKHYSEKKHRTR